MAGESALYINPSTGAPTRLTAPLAVAGGGTGSATGPLAQVALGLITKYQTSTLVFTADTVLANLPGLSLAVISGQTWRIRYKLLAVTSAGGGARSLLNITSPTILGGATESNVGFAAQRDVYADQGVAVGTIANAQQGTLTLDVVLTTTVTETITVQGTQYFADGTTTFWGGGASVLEATRLA